MDVATFLRNHWDNFSPATPNQLISLSTGWRLFCEAERKTEVNQKAIHIIRASVNTLSDDVNELRGSWSSTAGTNIGRMIRIESLQRRCDLVKGQIGTNFIRSSQSFSTSIFCIDDSSATVKNTINALVQQQDQQRTSMLTGGAYFAFTLLQPGNAFSKGLVIAGLGIANGVLYWISGKPLAEFSQMEIEILHLANVAKSIEIDIGEVRQVIESQNQ